MKVKSSKKENILMILYFILIYWYKIYHTKIYHIAHVLQQQLNSKIVIF